MFLLVLSMRCSMTQIGFFFAVILVRYQRICFPISLFPPVLQYIPAQLDHLSQTTELGAPETAFSVR